LIVTNYSETEYELIAQSGLEILYIKWGKDDKAQETFDKLMLIASSSGDSALPGALYQIAKTYENLNNYEKAKSIYQILVREYGASRHNFASQKGLVSMYILLEGSSQPQEVIDELTADLEEFIKALLTEAHRELSATYEQIIKIEPHRLLGYKTIELNNWQNRANVGISAAINNCRMQLTAQENRLSALNPRSVLQRGYSITTNKKTSLLVKTSEDVRIGDYLITELANENLIESEVKKK